MRIEDILAFAIPLGGLLIVIIYVLLTKPKEVEEDPRDKKIRELDLELDRIKND